MPAICMTNDENQAIPTSLLNRDTEFSLMNLLIANDIQNVVIYRIYALLWGSIYFDKIWHYMVSSKGYSCPLPYMKVIARFGRNKIRVHLFTRLTIVTKTKEKRTLKK